MSTEEKKEKTEVDRLIDDLFNQVLGIMEIKDLKQMALMKINEAETLEELVEATSYAAYTFIKKKEFTAAAGEEKPSEG